MFKKLADLLRFSTSRKRKQSAEQCRQKFLRQTRLSQLEQLEAREVFAVEITDATPYTQNFNTLPTSGTNQAWSNDTTLQGWYLLRQPAAAPVAITTINATTSNTGTFNSFGGGTTNPVSDRALGGTGSGGAYFGSPSSGAVAGWMAV